MNSSTTWPQVGIYPGITPYQYFAPHRGEIADRMISKSLLWDFYPNPKRWLLSPEKEITDAMKWGSLVDCLALTPERFEEAYRVQPATYMSAESAKKGAPMVEKPWSWNSNTCKAWRNNLPAGVECISESQMADARRAVEALKANRHFSEMMIGAQTQVGMRFDFGHGIHGIDGFKAKGKGLIDIVPHIDGEWGAYLCDLKTTAKLDDIEQVEKTIWNFGYHAQAALYLDMWNALTGEDREGFIFIFQLSTAPYEVAVVEIDEEAIIAGREWYMKAIAKWSQTVISGQWESPWDGIKRAGIPGWAKKRKEAA